MIMTIKIIQSSARENAKNNIMYIEISMKRQ